MIIDKDLEPDPLTALREKELAASQARLKELEARKQERLDCHNATMEYYRKSELYTPKGCGGGPPLILSADKRQEIIDAVNQGSTFIKLAKRYGVSRSTIGRMYYGRREQTKC